MNVQQPEECDKPFQRAVCQFFMGPFAQWMRATVNGGKEKYTKMMETPNTVLKGEEKQLISKHLRKRSTQIWISAVDTLLAMIVMRLPLPRAAQMYRVENLIRDM